MKSSFISSIILLLAPATFCMPQQSNGKPINNGNQAGSGGTSGSTDTATFNDYGKQPAIACSGQSKSDDNGVYVAAISDFSPLMNKHYCSYTDLQWKGDRAICTSNDGYSYQPPSGYQGPACDSYLCGNCYKVTNLANSKAVTVKIVDKCPKWSPYNYCKNVTLAGAPVGVDDKCAGSDNHLDISTGARGVLGAGNGNLNSISITGPIACKAQPGGTVSQY